MTKYHILIISILFLVSCERELNEDDEYDACEYCINDEKRFKSDIQIFYEMIKEDSDSNKIDSIKLVIDSLYSWNDSFEKDFANKNNLSTLFYVGVPTVRDSIMSTCYDYYSYGVGIENDKVIRMMWYLGDRIIELNKHYLEEGEDIKAIKYSHNSLGDTSAWKDGQYQIIDNFHEWNTTKFQEWEDWMVRINSYLFELTGKSYSQMTEREEYLLYFKLRYFLSKQKMYG